MINILKTFFTYYKNLKSNRFDKMHYNGSAIRSAAVDFVLLGIQDSHKGQNTGKAVPNCLWPGVRVSSTVRAALSGRAPDLEKEKGNLVQRFRSGRFPVRRGFAKQNIATRVGTGRIDLNGSAMISCGNLFRIFPACC